MDFESHRIYRGPLKAVILDWAGTTVDYGSFAPTAAFIKVFEHQGVTIGLEHARAPMGLMKKDHLRAIARLAPVAERWRNTHGRPCTEEDIEAMFQEFVPLQMECLRDYASLIPGTRKTVKELHKRGMKIGSTTGYTREMMEVLIPAAKKNGYSPDAWVSPSDVPTGRPFPWMCYQNAIQLQVHPLEAMVKVGDTLPDIEEGLNAGMWTVGLALTGNLMGLTEAQVAAMPGETIQARRQTIVTQLNQAGAHYVIDGIGDLPAIVEEIEVRLSKGERP
ncbi:MAG: phosphonoacetaldehyde hydrolase [Anaerolineales bacterium]|jgi:phosphonoacetaldehyde hydrolase